MVIPNGFEKIRGTFGVTLLQKDYKGGSPDFVQVVDFSQGAGVEVLHGPVQEKREGKGAYGGDDPRILSRSLKQYWNEFVNSSANPFCVVNGQFFYMPESPTRLPFPLKVDGEILSDGYGREQFQGKKLMLELWKDRADITLLTQEALYASTAPDIVAGLAEDAPKNIKKYVGRTFVGVVDKDGNDQYETLLILATRTARQVDAADVLRSFGAQKVMMLDGGGSTQMICQDKPILSSERLIPQALGIKGGIPPMPKSKNEISSAEEPTPVEPASDLPATAELAQAQPVQAEPVVEAVTPSVVVPVDNAPVETAPPQPAASPPIQNEPQPVLVQAAPAIQEQEPLPEPLYDLAGVLWVPGMMAPAFAFIFLVVWRMRFS
jgi:hypothetical protein